MVQVLLLASGLSMDSFSVAIGCGLLNNKFKKGLILSSFFSFFQMLMPVIGFLLGFQIEKLIGSLDHWIAFIILLLLGLKMIVDRKESPNKKVSEIGMSRILFLSLATSIDALIAGIGFAFLKLDIVFTVFVIGLITFIFSLTGYLLAGKIGVKLGSGAKILGGIILIAIGIKTLTNHLF